MAISSSAQSSSSVDRQPVSRGFFAYHGIWAPGVRLFRQLGFRMKALIVSIVLVLPLLALVGVQIAGDYQRGLQAEKASTMEHVQIAHGVMVWAHGLQASGQLTLPQAQALARAAISKLRYAGKEYFWINDMTPRVVMHPFKPELDGQDVSSLKDPNGLALFKAFADTVRRQGAGFVAYQWPKPGADVAVDKISYVMGFEPWGWIVGSGIYVDHVVAEATLRARIAGGVALGVLLLGGYLFWSFYLVMEGGLHVTERHLKSMAGGDLTVVPRPWGDDEAARLMLSLRAVQDSLRETVRRVRGASDDIVDASGGIAAGAIHLSERTEKAAADLQQTAASMEQISVTVKQTTDHVEQAAALARSNADVAARGGAVMQQMIATMEQIHASSSRIRDIIGTIDGIAFQTNILALNAAVEAARAGESGRGFAVVAQEVRALAQRSATAAREIKGLIGASVDQVQGGTAIVREAGATIDDIVVNAGRVNALLEQIALGASEESRGIGQIGKAVADLDDMTQQNAALVEETASAAASMKTQASALSLDVSRFRISDAPTPSA